MKRLLLLATLTVMTGCSLPQALQPDRPAALLFDQGLEELAGTGRTEVLQEVASRYPDSPWAARAEFVLGQNRRLKLAEKSMTACKRDTEVCRTELTRARKDLEELKRLVIEMELKTRSGSRNKR